MFYDLFSELCARKGVTPSKACLDMGLSRSLAAKWKNTKATPSFDVVGRIADYFSVTADFLLSGGESQEKEKATALSKKDERDISKKLEETLNQLESGQDGLMFDGEPLDDMTRELLLTSLKSSMEMGKKIAKQKYTPKKYR